MSLGYQASYEFEAEIVIERPGDAVWSFLSDHRNIPTWRDAARSVELVFGESLTVGARYEYEMHDRVHGLLGNRRVPLQLMQVSPGSCFTSQTLGGPADIEEETSISRLGPAQTRVTLQGLVRLSRWRATLAFLIPPLRHSRQRVPLRDLAALKDAIERSVPRPLTAHASSADQDI